MATMPEKRRAAAALAYLGEPSKVLAALANQFGRDERMPSRAEISTIIAERHRRRVHLYAERKSA
jgi:hypothetical protein